MEKNQSSITCTQCGQPYPTSGAPYLCACGGVFDFSAFPVYHPPKINYSGLWKHEKSLGLPVTSPEVTLGEGNTPLLQGMYHRCELYFKMESQNPTGSYKDRGTAVLVSFLLSRGVISAVEDSSGNAGASFAAYAARAGMEARVFIPESASGPKRWQIEMAHARVERIPGPRAEAARAVLNAVQEGSAYASHAYMPFGLAGIATIAYEVYETLGVVPGTVIAPVGHGGLLYGIMLGFEAIRDAGFISRTPYFIGVQPENCQPAVKAFQRGSAVIEDVPTTPTIAEGTSVIKPVRAGAILNRMLAGGGKMVAAREDQIRNAYSELACQGIFCEPTSSLAVIPILDDKIKLSEPVVVIMSGSGLKVNSIET